MEHFFEGSDTKSLTTKRRFVLLISFGLKYQCLFNGVIPSREYSIKVSAKWENSDYLSWRRTSMQEVGDWAHIIWFFFTFFIECCKCNYSNNNRSLDKNHWRIVQNVVLFCVLSPFSYYYYLGGNLLGRRTYNRNHLLVLTEHLRLVHSQVLPQQHLFPEWLVLRQRLVDPNW